MAARAATLCLLTGCASMNGLSGTWEGSCEVPAAAHAFSVDLVLDLAEGAAGRLEGQARLGAPGAARGVRLSGWRAGEQVRLDLDLGRGPARERIALEGHRGTHGLEGACTWTLELPEEKVVWRGAFTLARAGPRQAGLLPAF